jgi:DNA (cytosine-5)-methyltransferase 1
MRVRWMSNVDHPAELPTVLSLCTGYGGIERGLELAGYQHRTVAHVEIEAFAAANLVAKMEEGQLVPAPIWSDLKTLPAHCFRDRVDVLTGGYPCQPFSAAGLRKGAEDPRHLWPYIYDHIRTIRPIRCFFENVEGHISLGLRDVIADLESLGYATTWGVFSAAEVGAPHQRKRVYILADAAGARPPSRERPSVRQNAEEISTKIQPEFKRFGVDVADAISQGSQGRLPRGQDQERQDQQGHAGRGSTAHRQPEPVSWATEPDVGRVVNGAAFRVDRLRLLGNGVVPHTAAKAWIVLHNQLIKAMRE